MHFEAEGGDEVGGQRRTIGFLFLQSYTGLPTHAVSCPVLTG